MPEKQLVGKVSHWFGKISVAVVDLTGELRVGDRISIEGRGRSFEQTVTSMEIEHKAVQVATAGQSIGLKVEQPAKAGDQVFKIIG